MPDSANESGVSASEKPSYPLASLIKRLAALVYDVLVYAAIAMAYGFAVIGIKYGLLGVELAENQRAEIGVVGFFGLLATLWGFSAFFWLKKGGQTLGMKAWRLRLVGANGENLSAGGAVKRLIFGSITLLTGGLGYFWALLDSDSASLHDRLSATRVIQLPKVKK